MSSNQSAKMKVNTEERFPQGFKGKKMQSGQARLLTYPKIVGQQVEERFEESEISHKLK